MPVLNQNLEGRPGIKRKKKKRAATQHLPPTKEQRDTVRAVAKTVPSGLLVLTVQLLKQHSLTPDQFVRVFKDESPPPPIYFVASSSILFSMSSPGV